MHRPQPQDDGFPYRLGIQSVLIANQEAQQQREHRLGIRPVPLPPRFPNGEIPFGD